MPGTRGWGASDSLEPMTIPSLNVALFGSKSTAHTGVRTGGIAGSYDALGKGRRLFGGLPRCIAGEVGRLERAEPEGALR